MRQGKSVEFFSGDGGVARLTSDGYLEVRSPGEMALLDEKQQSAVEGLLQARRDERLGLWREVPDSTVFVKPRLHGEVLVVDESYGYVQSYRDIEAASSSSLFLGHVAVAYYKQALADQPWFAAEPGEVWEVTTANQVALRCFVIHNDPIRFVTPDGSEYHPDSIIDGRRIWAGGDQ